MTLFRKCFCSIIALLLVVTSSTAQAQKKPAPTIDTKRLSKRDLGKRLFKMLEKYGIDSGDYYIVDEPPSVLRALCVELSDSTIVTFQVDRTFHPFNSKNSEYSSICRKRVRGIGIAYKDCRTVYYGSGFLLWGIYNDYCIRNQRLTK